MSKSSTQLINELNARVASAKRIPRAGPTQLPLWHEQFRGLPNALARSALFSCVNHQVPRAELRRAKIVSIAGIEIYYSGTELRQDDEDVFLQIVHFARSQPLGEVVEISGNQLLRALGWNSSAKSYKRLRDIIERLKEGTVKLTQDQGTSGYAGSLIRKFAWQSESENGSRTKWKIYLEKEIINLFADNTFTLLDWQKRIKLGPLAKWVQAFYYTHAEPMPYKVAKLMELSGSKAATLHGFRRDLKAALERLVTIGFFRSYKIDPATDTLLVQRTEKRHQADEYRIPSLLN